MFPLIHPSILTSCFPFIACLEFRGGQTSARQHPFSLPVFLRSKLGAVKSKLLRRVKKEKFENEVRGRKSIQCCPVVKAGRPTVAPFITSTRLHCLALILDGYFVLDLVALVVSRVQEAHGKDHKLGVLGPHLVPELIQRIKSFILSSTVQNDEKKQKQNKKPEATENSDACA